MAVQVESDARQAIYTSVRGSVGDRLNKAVEAEQKKISVGEVSKSQCIEQAIEEWLDKRGY